MQCFACIFEIHSIMILLYAKNCTIISIYQHAVTKGLQTNVIAVFAKSMFRFSDTLTHIRLHDICISWHNRPLGTCCAYYAQTTHTYVFFICFVLDWNIDMGYAIPRIKKTIQKCNLKTYIDTSKGTHVVKIKTYFSALFGDNT